MAGWVGEPFAAADIEERRSSTASPWLIKSG
jgi:hypothetical protein